MIDKKPLTDHEEYFARYGEHLGECGDYREAWTRTERDLFKESGGVYRRYLSYESFKVAMSRHKRGDRPLVVSFRVVEMFWNKA